MPKTAGRQYPSVNGSSELRALRFGNGKMRGFWQCQLNKCLSRTVSAGGFQELVAKVLQETRLASQYLELELTESVLLSNAQVTFSVLQDLRTMGLKLAIDDFGTGSSSLSYLKQFPVSKLKIDRSFVREAAVNPDDAAITAAIIVMARKPSLKGLA